MLPTRMPRNLADRLYKTKKPESVGVSPRSLVPKIVLKQQLEPIQIKQVQDEPELLRANIPFQSHRIY